MSVIYVDFSKKPIKTTLSYQELIELVASLVEQGQVSLAEITISKHLKINRASAAALVVAIMLDRVLDSVETT